MDAGHPISQDEPSSEGAAPRPAPAELAPIARLALEAALEAVCAPAFLVGPAGCVCHANALGRAMLAAEAESVGARLEAAAEGAADCGIVLTRLEQPGHFLAVFPAGARDAKALGAAAALRWGLSERQREVLERLAEGRSNQAIAVDLGCAIGTLELHVSTILERAGAQSRAELVARFWTCT